MGAGSSNYEEPQLAYPAPVPPAYNYSTNFSRIEDNFKNIEQVKAALQSQGLESCNLILAVDFTKSNEWNGKHSFNGRSLHCISEVPNPYEQAIDIVGRTLQDFDDDGLVPCFGFGDASTHDQNVFSFYEDRRPCNGFEEALARYRFIAPHVRLAGPTSFAPAIQNAMRIVEESGGHHHILVIIADGEVTRSVDTTQGQLSPYEQSTIDAIVDASRYSLSIVVVGVGDGPWDRMKEFDDNIPARAFDNFQFVNFTDIMKRRNLSMEQKEAMFAVSALMEVPIQYQATVELGTWRTVGSGSCTLPLPPPPQVIQADCSSTYSRDIFNPATNDFIPSAPRINESCENEVWLEGLGYDENLSQACPICMTEKRDMAFGCGHRTCKDCGQSLQLCPLCRQQITQRIQLY